MLLKYHSFADPPVSETGLREEFLKQQDVFESLSNLSDSQKSEIGFQPGDMILDCQYAGQQCSFK